MHPAFSVIFLTTLIGAGQGLFLALYTAQVYAAFRLLPAQEPVGFYALGSLIALLLLMAGLGASFLHLGRPERAWRSAAMWRTSWLSREVIALPACMGAVAAWVNGCHTCAASRAMSCRAERSVIEECKSARGTSLPGSATVSASPMLS